MNVPVMAVGLDKVLVTATEIEEYVAGVQGNFKSRGYAEFVFDQVAVKLLGQNLAFLSYSGQRRTKDGTVLEKGAGGVFLQRTNTGWKVAAYATYPLEDFIKLD